MKTFEQLGIIDPLVKAVTELGFESPMAVQEEVIPYLLGEDIDLVALAQTGTGKTAAFGLPMLQKLTTTTEERDKKNNCPLALILSPTRELCLQIADDLASYAKYLPKIRVVPVYGGASIEAQMRAIDRGVEIVVATPGRLIDLLNRKTLSLSNVHTVVLDEADEMLNMGFSESIDEILSSIPPQRHLLLFSATMPPDIARIARSYLNNPKEITIGNKNATNENIKHIYYVVSAKYKYLALKRIADFYPNIYAIVFCRTRAETKDVAEQLIKDGYNADALHGDLSQAQRDYVMQRFRLRNISMLVATDVAARGLDVNDLTHVIHYGLPDEAENYTHRSGRTARAGKTGLSISICHSRERGRIRMIEQKIGRQIDRAFLPDGRAICEKQIIGLAERIERELPDENTDIDAIIPIINRKLDWLDRDELIRRIASLEFRRLFEYYRVAPHIEEGDERGRVAQSGDKPERQRHNKRGANAEEGMVRLSINFGKNDRMFPNKLIELINRCCPGPRVKVGKIDLLAREAFFDVDEHEAESVMNEMNRYEVNARPIRVAYASNTGGNRATRSNGRRFDRKAVGNKEHGSSDGRAGRRYTDRDGHSDSYAPKSKYKSKQKKEKDKNGGGHFYDKFKH